MWVADMHAFSLCNVCNASTERLRRARGTNVVCGTNVEKVAVSEPCKVSVFSYRSTNKMHLLSQIIYSCKTLYMFRTVFPSIIRSSKLSIQQRYMSNSCCYRTECEAR